MENIREIKLEQDTLQFLFLNADTSKAEVTLQAGPNFIMDKYFSSEYPNEGEMEKALNYIEYELTKHKELNNNNENLVCKNALLSEMFGIEEQPILVMTL